MRTATFDPRGGTLNSPSTLYYDTRYSDAWYTQSTASSSYRISSITPPTKAGCSFKGFYYYSDGVGYQIVHASGVIYYRPSLDLGDITLYAEWDGPSSATLSKSDLSGGPTSIFYDAGNLYDDASMSSPLPAATVQEGGQSVIAWGPIALPAKECYVFQGYWSAANNTGTLYIDENGYVRQALRDKLASMTVYDSLTIYAKGVEVSRKLTLSANGGSGGLSAIYNSLADRSKWYVDSLCAGDPVTSVPIPGKVTSANAGYVFNGYKYSSTIYIDDAGALTGALTSLTNFTNRTATAQWQSTTKMTVNANGGEGGDAFFYWCSARSAYYHAIDGVLTQTAKIEPPTYPGYAFAGLYTAATGGTQKVAADGTIASGLTSATTLYAQWTKTAFPVTFSGAPETLPLFYVKATGGGLYRDAECLDPVAVGDSLWDSPPVKDGYVFLGVFAEDASSSVRYTTAAGAATADFVALTASGDVTVYCVFAELQPVSFDDAGGAGGPGSLWYINHALYADSHGETPASWPLAVPTRECFAFQGYLDGTGDTQYVSASGEMTQALSDLVAAGISEPLDLVAQWNRLTWRVTLGEDGTVYSLAGGEVGWTSDPEGTNAITSVPVPEREGYVFLGYFTAGGMQAVGSTGDVVEFVGDDGDIVLTAKWNAATYTLSFSDGSTSKTVAYDSQIGTLPTPTVPAGLVFEGWVVDGVIVSSSTVWRWASDVEAIPQFGKPKSAGFADVTDWFNLASSALVPISSDSGDVRKRTCVTNASWSGGKQNGGAGRFSADVSEVGGTWRNPTVTYRVCADVDLGVTLGKAYAASGADVSGYMITGVRVSTAVGAFPTVTVTATANEGVNAINLFSVSIPVKARSRAQNLLNAISGGGQLQTCDVVASCSAVVCEENNMPCASDVVQGRYTVNATTYAPNGESAPAGANGFTSVGRPRSGGDVDYAAWSITVEKEIT